jgi:hypothetical protein
MEGRERERETGSRTYILKKKKRFKGGLCT